VLVLGIGTVHLRCLIAQPPEATEQSKIAAGSRT